ncbi:hypothetical protein RUM44_002399 [Polyplax serrata]|uniref:Sprouty n=1 Tax=Polyplax serrata TaxID=468196 RepID=A0ABR1AEN6_POLSC
MESHGGRSLETPHGVAPTEQRTVTPLLSAVPLDVRESGEPIFHRVDGSQVPPTAPRRPNCPVRVYSRPQMALVTAPPPQTCVLQPITSSGPIRTTNLVRSSSRTSGGSGPGSGAGVRRNACDFPAVTSSNGRLENNLIPATPVLAGRSHSLSTSRLQNTNQFSNSLTNSATRGRTVPGSVNSSVEAVSLTLPRPETERTANEYVETPLRSGLSLIEPKLEPVHRTIRSAVPPSTGISLGPGVTDDGTRRDSNFAMVTLPVTGLERNCKHGERSSQRHAGLGVGGGLGGGGAVVEEKVVTTQPSATFKKDRFQTELQCSRQNDDIICSECKRCRCESCRTPRPLPSKWLCGTCHCSADTIVDYTTCLCCAKAFFYHCSNDEAVSYESDPCSCSRDMFYARWGCLGLMSLILPCLFCYWPCRGLVQICESCHQYYSSHGCRCQKLYQEPSPLTFEKRLLDSPE